jgi:peptide/nickel transport system substrate-binding protein
MHRWKPLSLAMGLVLLLAACGTAGQSPSATSGGSQPAGSGAASPSEGAVKEGGTFVVAIPGEIDNLDPAMISDSNSSYVMNQVMQGLVGLAPGSISKIDPVLATEWSVSDDGLTYTFTLRDGVKFHDGTDFNADAVKYNYERWINLPENLQQYAYYFGAVFGGFGKDANIDSVTTEGTNKVSIKLKQPQSNFLLSQTLTPFFISSPTALKGGNADEPDIKKNDYAQSKGMVGTGPFKFKEWVSGDHVTVDKNPDYWDTANAAHVDSIVFKPYGDQTAEFNALQSGEVDFAQTIAPVDAESAKGDANLQIVDRGESCNLGNLAINSSGKYKPVDNLKIRQAIGYAVNKQSYIDAFYAGQAKPADNWMPPATQFYKALNLPTYDPNKAKQLIQESGETDLTIDFWYPSNVASPYMPDPKGLFEAIQRDLEAVGFKITPHTAPWNPDYLDAESAGDYEMWLIGWTCDGAGPDNFLNTFFGYKNGEPNPEFGYKNDQVDQLMKQALAETDESKQAELWGQVQDLLAADLPTVPLVHSTPPAAAQSYVKGIVGSGALNEYFNSIWLDK